MNGEQWAMVAVAAGLALRCLMNEDTRKWLWARPTDWNAVRCALGYEAAPDQPVCELPSPRGRRLLGFWPLATDWDAERRRLGYGVTIEGQCWPSEAPSKPPSEAWRYWRNEVLGTLGAMSVAVVLYVLPQRLADVLGGAVLGAIGAVYYLRHRR